MSLDNLTILERLGLYFIVFIFIGSILELGLFVYAYFDADKATCSLLWCSFTLEKGVSEISSYSECFVNVIENGKGNVIVA